MSIESGVKYFSFTPSEDGTYTISTEGECDTFGYLYTPEGEELAQNDDVGNNRNFSIKYNLKEGKTYIVGAKQWEGLPGQFTLSVIKDKVSIAVPNAVTDLVYTGSTLTGVEAGTGYTLTGNTAKDAGTYIATATPNENYKWDDGTTETKRIAFAIEPASITEKTASLSSTSYTYNGKAKAPTVTINGLTKGTDFKVSYRNNINAGTGTVTITGLGNYTGALTKTFTIKRASISGKTMTLSTSAYTYDGNLKKPIATVTGLKAGTDFKVTYSSNKYVGKATAKVTGIGNYTGTLTKTFKINPKGTTISSLAAGTKAFTVKWNKQATQTSGYQIRYSRNSDMSSAKTVTISGTSTVSKTVKSLYAKKKYYVQVRTYKTVNSVKYYSSWSSKKYVTTK